MKITFPVIYFSAVVLLQGLIISSCNKPDVVTSPSEGSIYMPRAAGNNNKLSLLVADTAQTVIFGAAYGGLNYPSGNITVTFTVDSALISAYNALNGTSYRMLPAASYTIPSLSGTIRAGQTSSDIIPAKIITTGLNRGGKYILPVSIASVSSGSINSALRTAYFTIDTIQRLEADVTSKAALGVSKENDGGSGAGEGSPKLVDGDINSKFLISGYTPAFWVQLKFPAAQVISAYTLTSGNDSPERDPKDWNLVGSTDGTAWTTLDTRPGEIFSGRNQTKRYEITNKTAYTYYRLNITANGGNSLFQCSEWRLITYP